MPSMPPSVRPCGYKDIRVSSDIRVTGGVEASCYVTSSVNPRRQRNMFGDGVVLNLICGVGIAQCSLFLSRLDLRWAIRFCPVADYYGKRIPSSLGKHYHGIDQLWCLFILATPVL